MASRDCRSARLALLAFSVFILASCQSEERSGATNVSPPLALANSDSLETPQHQYVWSYTSEESIASRIPAPEGYRRMPHAVGSFESWLRFLPLKPSDSPVMLYDGSEKWNQNAHIAVLDIDVGSKDLQQCADATMRLRAEYLYQAGDFSSIHFNFTSGDRIDFNKWKAGNRPRISGNDVGWTTCSSCDGNYESFRKYMEVIFTYAGTSSLSRELNEIDTSDLRSGDILIFGGFPGHAVMLVDEAINKEGQKVFLLCQSYMPAQEMHVLKNPNDERLGPWYSFQDEPQVVNTPEWTFDPAVFRRYGE